MKDSYTEAERQRERGGQRHRVGKEEMGGKRGGGEGERGQEPRASSGSPMWVQGPEHLGHLLLLSHIFSRELKRK